jgi:hypothetical protein
MTYARNGILRDDVHFVITTRYGETEPVYPRLANERSGFRRV